MAPSTYSTLQGGGAGDARINVRENNLSVMINGVPVNDMENGWVHWSNWDGLGDASTSIRLQRGLSAVNLATPSIGGTLNVITDPSAMRSGFSYRQEAGLGSVDAAGEWGFGRNLLKETLTVHSGRFGCGFALTGSLVRHSCFWHRQGSCSMNRIPKSHDRQEFWRNKLVGNVRRDRFNQAALRALGWAVLVIRECETKDVHRVAREVPAFVG